MNYAVTLTTNLLKFPSDSVSCIQEFVSTSASASSSSSHQRECDEQVKYTEKQFTAKQ